MFVMGGSTSAPASLKGNSVIDLGSTYGKLIHPVMVDGTRWYYYWNKSGTGTANSGDIMTHIYLNTIFMQDTSGVTNPTAGTPTSNTYRYATINEVKLALPTVGDGSSVINSEGYRNGTAVSGTAVNDTYDDYLAIWDAYTGVPPGWSADDVYWSATPAASGHSFILLRNGYVYGYVNDYYSLYYSYVAVEVL